MTRIRKPLAPRTGIAMKVKYLNARSVCNKTNAIRELIVDNSLDILCISETWLTDSDRPVIADLLPTTHNFFHSPRTEGRGGGVALIISNEIKQVKSIQMKFSSFECLQAEFNHNGRGIALFCIYRPPGNKTLFLNEFEEFILESQTNMHQCLYVGDFNIWVDDLSDSDADKFLKMLEDYNLKNHIDCPTYDSGHILDLLITRKSASIIKSLQIEPVCTISDHRIISFCLDVPFTAKSVEIIKFRRIQSDFSLKLRESLDHLVSDISSSCVHSSDTKCVDCLNISYKHIAKNVYNNHAPIIEKTIKVTDRSNLWFNTSIKVAKKKLRKAEKIYVQHRSESTRCEFVRLRREKDNLIQSAKTEYLKNRFKNCGSD